mmetsp:Transcript_5937/g.21711  ORF Transcript_5937/g.21711 Transcript_5937/m.21711 type:complete len:462 (+) Transcript_5937:1726-3111(+)
MVLMFAQLRLQWHQNLQLGLDLAPDLPQALTYAVRVALCAALADLLHPHALRQNLQLLALLLDLHLHNVHLRVEAVVLRPWQLDQIKHRWLLLLLLGAGPLLGFRAACHCTLLLFGICSQRLCCRCVGAISIPFLSRTALPWLHRGGDNGVVLGLLLVLILLVFLSVLLLLLLLLRVRARRRGGLAVRRRRCGGGGGVVVVVISSSSSSAGRRRRPLQRRDQPPQAPLRAALLLLAAVGAHQVHGALQDADEEGGVVAVHGEQLVHAGDEAGVPACHAGGHHDAQLLQREEPRVQQRARPLLLLVVVLVASVLVLRLLLRPAALRGGDGGLVLVQQLHRAVQLLELALHELGQHAVAPRAPRRLRHERREDGHHALLQALLTVFDLHLLADLPHQRGEDRLQAEHVDEALARRGAVGQGVVEHLEGVGHGEALLLDDEQHQIDALRLHEPGLVLAGQERGA